ncbi:tumor necrosis factor receptor superfamily member 14-like [Hypanus sabinus]|uniref:tumor necrosis factor receptor superfamily member 14-like n=1 Tax=Hypanus sabinus TaxID=79690 RepID=UPI0028C37891|nr:tumor necrosis factor receptor superfamily member 14-like [Hypanus sabinus]
MHLVPMKTENWKSLPVIPDVSLLTALLITVWTVIGCDLALIFTGNHWDHVSSRRWHGLESIDKSTVLSKRNGYEQMVQIPAGVENLHLVAPTLQALLLIVSIVTYITYQVNSEKYRFIFSATKYEEFIKISFLLFLISQIPVTTACDPGEYDNNGVCCSLCSPGTRVSKHCTLMTGTTCNPCTNGEYMEHPNGLEKCFKCKICDAELGLQVKQGCAYTRNTICEPREGYYCVDGCQIARKYTACPPGEGVKEKGTPFKDTVCEKCPDGTFSSEASTTEECKSWTVCEMPKFKQVEPGSAETDRKCEKVSVSNRIVFVSVAVVILLVIPGIVVLVLWKKHKCKTGNQNIQSPRNHNGDVKLNEPPTDEEKALRDGERAE